MKQIKDEKSNPVSVANSRISQTYYGDGQSKLTKKSYFSMKRETIFEAILRTMVLGSAVNLKKKARIKIKDSCVLIGIPDDRGIL